MPVSTVRTVDYWPRIEKLRRALKLRDEEFSDLIGMKTVAYRRARKSKKDIAATHVFAAIKEANVSFDAFMKNQVDFKTLRMHRSGTTDYIPERYQFATRSRLRTTLNFLGYLKVFHGTEVVDDVLRFVQFPREHLSNPDLRVNVNLNSDVTRYIHNRSKSLALAVEMGAYSARLNMTGPVAQAVAGMTNARDVFETVPQFFGSHYEENYQYTLTRLTSTGAQFSCREREDAQEDLKRKRLRNEFSCLATGGVLSSFPELAGLPRTKLEKSRCVFRGDSECRYELHYQNA